MIDINIEHKNNNNCKRTTNEFLDANRIFITWDKVFLHCIWRCWVKRYGRRFIDDFFVAVMVIK